MLGAPIKEIGCLFSQFGDCCPRLLTTVYFIDSFIDHKKLWHQCGFEVSYFVYYDMETLNACNLILAGIPLIYGMSGDRKQ